MRNIIAAFALLFFAASAMAQSRITLLITFTNAPTTSNTITINGVTRTWTNAATSTTILTNLVSANGSKTNLFSQFSRWWTFSGPLNLVDVGTNSFKVVGTLGGSLTASVSEPYAILTLSTQSGTATYTALYPLENMSSMTDRVNEASSLVYGLGTYSTNAFATNSAAISNSLIKGASPLQRVQGSVLFDSVGGVVTGLTNGVYQSPNLIDPMMTNGAAAGYVLTSDASGNMTWEPGGSGGSATNAQPPSAVLSNLVSNPYLGYTNGATVAAGTNIIVVTNGVAPIVYTVHGTANGSGGSAGTNIAIGQTLYLDASFGNDSTASRTNLLRPFLTASNFTAAILSGDSAVSRGGTYLINPRTNFAEFPNLNSSGGVTISNRNNFRLTGEPGAVWAMSSRISIGGTSSAPMMVISKCTNFVVERMTFVGIRTNTLVSLDFALMLDQCANWTIRDCIFSNWQDQAITDGGLADGLQTTVNQNARIQGCQFWNVGGTNSMLLCDGAAISVNASNFVWEGNLFVHCFRDIEFYRNGDIRGGRIANNVSYGNYGQVLVFEATNNISEVEIVGNRAYGYSPEVPSGCVTEATFLQLFGGSNITVFDNTINGMSGVVWIPKPTISLLDLNIWENTIADVVYRAILIRKAAPTDQGYQERLSIKGNKIRNTLNGAIQVQGNNVSIVNNEIHDGNTTLQIDGVISVGSLSAAFATNSTNVVVTGNILSSSVVTGAVAAASGIMIYQQCYSNFVSGNIIEPRYFTTNIHNVGIGTRTRPVNLVATGSLLRTDAAGDERAVTIGSGVTFDGTTLSASGGSTQLVTAAIGTLTITNSLSVSNLNIATLVVTNGLPAPGSNGQILFNGTNIITASPQNTLDEFGVMTISSLISPSVLLQDQVSYGMTNIFVGAANSNQTVLLGKTANMMLSNSVTFTNFSTLASTRNATYLAMIRVVASTNVNVNWGLGIGYDAGRVTTNANNPIWPVLTNGQMYVASWTGFGTNRILRLSLEQ